MSVLHISPDSHVLVHAAAAAVLYLHVGAGTVGLLAGAAAFVFRKGSRLHRQAGKVFVIAMLVLGLLLYRLGHVGYGALRRRARSQVLAAPPP